MLNERHLIVAIAGISLVTPGFAAAQPPMPYQTPAVSPYLNLVRPGTPASLNYYNLVRPQIEFSSSIQQLQQQTSLNRQGLNNLQQSMNGTSSTLPPTGFVPQFQSHRGYFMTYSGGGVQIPSRGLVGGVRGFGNGGAILPRAMGVPSLGVPALGVPAIGAPSFR